MPARHSKNTGSRPHFTYHEKSKAFGSVTQRLGGESQLPFGYCALSLSPAEDAVVSPSGRLYGREYILEYILTKTQELKKQQREFEEQQEELRRREGAKLAEHTATNVSKFIETHDGVKSTLKRKADEVAEPVKGYIDTTRLKKFDDTDDTERRQKLSQSAPWVPQFTPQAQETVLKEPPKRPSSPFSGRPLRSKDLVSIELVKECDGSANSSIVKYLCPVSRKTITNQKVVLIKTTGAYMIEQAALDLAYPTMTCPLTGKKFCKDDVVELCAARSGKAALGGVVASVHKPEFN